VENLTALSGLTSLRLALNPQLPAASAPRDAAVGALGRMSALRRLQLSNGVGVTDAGLAPLSGLLSLTNLRLSGACLPVFQTQTLNQNPHQITLIGRRGSCRGSDPNPNPKS